ncbi:MAG: hypothetical protein K0S32_280 [Bacteroidetes bacterium]|jgi:uncharacterized protein YdhG (YjbR/CyaY superfamily)|nr:hypothetical protein [Bacteroidota bacterium]
MKTEYKNIDQYIADQPEEIRETLEHLRLVIKKAAPKAEEGIGYGMPSYKLAGPLVYFGNFKTHYSFFPGSGSLVEKFKEQLKKYETSKGTIKFPYGTKVPVKLITDMVKFRVKENTEKESLKKTKKKTAKKKS